MKKTILIACMCCITITCIAQSNQTIQANHWFYGLPAQGMDQSGQPIFEIQPEWDMLDKSKYTISATVSPNMILISMRNRNTGEVEVLETYDIITMLDTKEVSYGSVDIAIAEFSNTDKPFKYRFIYTLKDKSGKIREIRIQESQVSIFCF